MVFSKAQHHRRIARGCDETNRFHTSGMVMPLHLTIIIAIPLPCEIDKPLLAIARSVGRPVLLTELGARLGAVKESVTTLLNPYTIHYPSRISQHAWKAIFHVVCRDQLYQIHASQRASILSHPKAILLEQSSSFFSVGLIRQYMAPYFPCAVARQHGGGACRPDPGTTLLETIERLVAKGGGETAAQTLILALFQVHLLYADVRSQKRLLASLLN
jgi:hypothetical protein